MSVEKILTSIIPPYKKGASERRCPKKTMCIDGYLNETAMQTACPWTDFDTI